MTDPQTNTEVANQNAAAAGSAVGSSNDPGAAAALNQGANLPTVAGASTIPADQVQQMRSALASNVMIAGGTFNNHLHNMQGIHAQHGILTQEIIDEADKAKKAVLAFIGRMLMFIEKAV